MYYPCSENTGADQLRGYREADSASLFSHMQIVGFLMRRRKYLSKYMYFSHNVSINYTRNYLNPNRRIIINSRDIVDPVIIVEL